MHMIVHVRRTEVQYIILYISKQGNKNNYPEHLFLYLKRCSGEI